MKPTRYAVPVEFTDPIHKPHLENFFTAMRGEAQLTCPPETGYETVVTILKINEAVKAGTKLAFSPEEFTV